MDLTYRVSTPDGASDNSYLVFNEGDLSVLLQSAGQAKSDVSAAFTHVVDANDIHVGYLISRSDPNFQARYDDFTPTNNALPVMKDTFYYQGDQDFMTHVQAQNPGIDFNANPELTPDFCLVSTLEQSYTFDIPAV